ncbi:hypothetical protein Q9L42_019480 [Methylomarinum sp. Ch1-1]|uniref:Uncharacterized protein n=1 Tax=Methylomarinum roseum TaxID=3067653 RepID=A0AAU7NV19_9GAMM|nr:hypothetical protein [Methylomarinum sp. Ch1-1]MDP4519419.1 hypothetical protein [Methylomarinum sp. Ch1-1]
MKKIASKISKRLSKVQASKIIDLSSYRQQKQEAEALFSQIKTTQKNIDNGHDPLHAVYIHAQNLLSVLVDCLQEVPEPALDRFFKVIDEADRDYMPEGPPISPLTKSYFNSWLLFDLVIGLDKETLTTIILDLARQFGLDKQMIETIGIMQDSRMGIYEFIGRQNGHILLKELTKDSIIECICPAGYQGSQPGELWFVRILPPVFDCFDYSLVFTTPYVLSHADKNAWLDYLARTVTGKKTKTTATDVNQLMKYGLSPFYWHEYIFEAYLDARSEVIFLSGLPDIRASRPQATDIQEFLAILPERQ